MNQFNSDQRNHYSQLTMHYFIPYMLFYAQTQWKCKPRLLIYTQTWSKTYLTCYFIHKPAENTNLACYLLGWPNSAQNLVTSRFFHDFMPCSTRRHSKTREPILKWKIPHERSCPELSNDTNNMQQMFLLTQIAESFWTQFSAKSPLLTRF